jgi:hypothetical protein
MNGNEAIAFIEGILPCRNPVLQKVARLSARKWDFLLNINTLTANILRVGACNIFLTGPEYLELVINPNVIISSSLTLLFVSVELPICSNPLSVCIGCSFISSSLWPPIGLGILLRLS